MFTDVIRQALSKIPLVGDFILPEFQKTAKNNNLNFTTLLTVESRYNLWEGEDT